MTIRRSSESSPIFAAVVSRELGNISRSRARKPSTSKPEPDEPGTCMPMPTTGSPAGGSGGGGGSESVGGGLMYPPANSESRRA